LIAKETGIIPATPLAILAILDYYKVALKNKNITVLGRSNLVGGPIAKLLKKRGAKVKVGHSQTLDISKLTENADILISAVGSPNLISGKMIKKNAFVIDVGTTTVAGKTKGDTDFEKVSKIAGFITPSVGGIGPVTVIKLMENILRAYKFQNK